MKNASDRKNGWTPMCWLATYNREDNLMISESRDANPDALG
jgi:hypothetical protein